MTDETRNDNTVTDTDTAAEQSGGLRERWHKTLVERARAISNVRNDVYTTKFWQVILNMILGLVALVLIVLSMVFDGVAQAISIVAGAVAVIAVIVYNYALKKYTPMSFLQYTCFADGKRYCYRVMSKTTSVFSDGENVIQTDGHEALKLDAMPYEAFAFDFFANMVADERIGKADTETFIGTLDTDDGKVKCKIVFKNGEPYYGTIGGARIKYFDVNDTKEKFILPIALKRAAKELNVNLPKLSGVYFRDDMRDITKQ